MGDVRAAKKRLRNEIAAIGKQLTASEVEAQSHQIVNKVHTISSSFISKLPAMDGTCLTRICGLRCRSELCVPW